MELFLVIVWILFVTTLCGLVFLYLAFRETSVFLDEESAIKVVKFIEAIREVFPVGSTKGWTLLFNNWGVRCWKQQLSFNILGVKPTVYGSSVIIPASAVSVLNFVADTNTGKEWDPSIIGERRLRAEMIPDVRLQSDEYMQCDRLVTYKSPSCSEVQMYRFVSVKNCKGTRPPCSFCYRFGQIERNGVCWILLWHIKRLEWCFYLAQPIENIWDDQPVQCLFTAVKGFNESILKKVDVQKKLVDQLLGIKDAIKTFNIKTHSFQSLSSSSDLHHNSSHHLTTYGQSYKFLSSVPCKLLQNRANRSPVKVLHHKEVSVLTLVPFGTAKPVSLSNHKGFALFHWPETGSSPSSHHSTPRHRPRIKYELRCRSGSFNMDRISQGHAIKQRALSADGRMPDASLPITKVDNNDDLHAVEPLLSLAAAKLKTTSAVELCDSKTVDDYQNGMKHNEKIEIYEGQLEKNSSDSCTTSSETELESLQGSKLNVERTSSCDGDFEILLPQCNPEDEPLNYKTKGNFCVSELLAEVIKASVIEVHSPPEIQKATTNGWMFDRLHKDVTVLTRVRPFGSLSVMSYLSKGIINVPPNIVWSALQSPLSRYMYDDTLKKVTVLQDFSNGQKVLHTFHESTTLLKKEAQDFCLLHTEREEGTKLIVAIQSIEYENCPLMQDVNRGMLFPSGWIVEPYINDEKCCIVSYLIQLLVNNPDNLVTTEMGNTQPQCIVNLSSYLSSKPL